MADESVCQGLCLAVLHRLTKGGGRQGWTELCEREELLHGHIRLHGHCWLPWNFRSRTNLLIVWNKWADKEEYKHIKTVEHMPTCKVKHIVSINHSWHDDCRFMHVKLENDCFHFFLLPLVCLIGLVFLMAWLSKCNQAFPSIPWIFEPTTTLFWPFQSGFINSHSTSVIYSLLASVSLSSQASGEKQQTEACWHNFD